MSPRRGRCGRRGAIADSSRPPMAARPGSRSWLSASTPASQTFASIRAIRMLYAATYQRRRNVGVLIAGGPESAIYKTTDAGKQLGEAHRPGMPEK